jgi:hypothetical protein
LTSLYAPDCHILILKHKEKRKKKERKRKFEEKSSGLTSNGENSGDRGSTVRAAFPLYIEWPTKTLGGDSPTVYI